MKRRLRLTEGDLMRIVNKSVKRVLREDTAPKPFDYDDDYKRRIKRAWENPNWPYIGEKEGIQILSDCRKLLLSANSKIKRIMFLAQVGENDKIEELAKQIDQEIFHAYAKLYDNFSGGSEYWQA